MPFLVRWPRRIPAGTACSEPITCLDILPTACAAAGVKLPPHRSHDGADVLPTLRGRADGPLHEALFWKDDCGHGAVRSGSWKLLNNRNGETELYDLRNDLGETTNAIAQQPAIARRLREQYETWAATLAPRIARRRRREAR